MLVIGLGALALLLFVGAGIGIAMKGKKTTTTTTSLDLGSATTAPVASSVAHVDEPTPPDVTSAAPLDSSGMKIPVAPVNNGGATTPKTPTAKSVPTPTPVQPPPPKDPPECKTYRDAKAANRPAAIVNALATKCRNAGGTP
jgi:hypothetical protein